MEAGATAISEIDSLPRRVRLSHSAIMIRAHSPGAVMLSATLHAAVFSALVAGAWWLSRARELPARGREFVIVPGGDLEFPGARAAGPEVAPAGNPLVYQPSPVERKPIPVPIDSTAPDVKPVPPARQGKPATPGQAPGRPTHSPRPPRPTASAPAAGPASAPAIPVIDGDALARELVAKGNLVSKEGQTAPLGPGDAGPDSAELVGYFERLKTALQAAHEMPVGVDELFVSRVSFFLATDGTLSSVRVLNPSGNSAYDQSVLAAFAKVRSIGAVPGGQSGARTISFKMTE